MRDEEEQGIGSSGKSSKFANDFDSPPDYSLTNVLWSAIAPDVTASCNVRRFLKLLLLATSCLAMEDIMPGNQAVMIDAVVHLQRSWVQRTKERTHVKATAIHTACLRRALCLKTAAIKAAEGVSHFA